MQHTEFLQAVKEKCKDWKKNQAKEAAKIYTSGYTTEQIFYQIKKATDQVIGACEEYLAGADVDPETEPETDLESLEHSEHSESFENLESSESSENPETGLEDSLEHSESPESFENPENPENPNLDLEEESETNPDSDYASSSASIEYSSSALLTLTKYLEGDMDSDNEMLKETAGETLRKLK
ncbi:hypothetical protein NEDG_01498 [Nematocida displodere]|uniref:Uncharacterized protein n=1 Tax=Nematocida displodere TaxID=1805483 RepID=A0A177EEP7_9MICR|nr:hypothetical protein NEDG_01498 [Nematocida displodere]